MRHGYRLILVSALLVAFVGAAVAARAAGWSVTPVSKWYACQASGYFTLGGAHLGIVADGCQAMDGSGPAPWNGLEYHFVVLNGRQDGVPQMLALTKSTLDVRTIPIYFYTTGATYTGARGNPIVVGQVMTGDIPSEMGVPY
jgi:hypothetical protein